jgi:Asp-tRNA(Asn)/Glu-tRNA(Gln) amidotransferase A subunit family amidase
MTDIGAGIEQHDAGHPVDDSNRSDLRRAHVRPPLMLRARDLVRRIEGGTLTPRAAIDLCADAIAARERDVGAFVALDLDAARRHADVAQMTRLPLRGLPVGMKDIFDTADLPTAYGSPIHAGYRPNADAAMVTMARRAGAIMLGKTVTCEFASLEPAGTRNPHNGAHTPGGSSSGSAAAVAAGMLPLAFGSQTGGSIIRPAAFCGVAGFKPSYKMLPTVGMKCFSWSLDTVGLFAASVVDVAFAAAAVSGRDLAIDGPLPAPPTIALLRTHLWDEASGPMQAAVERAAHAAERAGARIRQLELPPILREAMKAHRTIQDYEAFRALAYEYDHHRDRIGATLRKQLDQAAAIEVDAYDDARRVTRRARLAFADLIADGEVILTPSAPGAAPRGLTSTGQPTFNRLWTLMGTPCVNVPGLSDSEGMPLGVQIVARFGRDRFALAAAAFVEAALGALNDAPAEPALEE